MTRLHRPVKQRWSLYATYEGYLICSLRKGRLTEDGETASLFSQLCLHFGILAEAQALIITARQGTSGAIRHFRHLFIINPLSCGWTNGNKGGRKGWRRHRWPWSARSWTARLFSFSSRQTFAKSIARLKLSLLRTAKNGKAEHVTTNKESWRWLTQCAHVKEEERGFKEGECALQRILTSTEILDWFRSAIRLILHASSSFSKT